ncbi:MAG: 2-hydroxyacid dehydrogenase [Sedimenticola sp.]
MKILFAAPERAWGGLLAGLREDNPHYDFIASGDFKINSLEGVDVLIPTMTQVTAADLKGSPQLKLIQQVGVGLEGVDLATAAELDIQVANVPSEVSGNADSVAEMGIYLMIGLGRNVRGMAESFSQRRIGNPMGQALKGKTVGLVGLGGIGKALAARLQPFGVRLIGIKQHNPQSICGEFGLDWAGTLVDLPRLLGESDYVVLAIPDTHETHCLMGEIAFTQMKPGACLINLGRGGLIERDALEKALVEERIAGAGLDVFWEEPVNPEDPIFRQNILPTPHIAGATDIAKEGIQAAVSENLRRLERGEELLYCR